MGDAPASEDPTWAFGRVCNSHLSQYLAGILEERLGTPLFAQAPRGQTLEERVAHWLDPVNGFVKGVGGCLVQTLSYFEQFAIDGFKKQQH